MASVVIAYEGTDYTLEFNRKSADILEKNYDFSLENVSNGKYSSFADLFYCAFLMHHPRIKRATADKIMELTGSKEELFEVLVRMYTDAVSSLFETQDEEKALTWKETK